MRRPMIPPIAPQAPLQRNYYFALSDRLMELEIGAAGVRDGWNPHLALAVGRRRDLLDKLDAGRSKRLGVGAQVNLGHLNEIVGVKEFADCYLLLDRPSASLAVVALQDRFLQVV